MHGASHLRRRLVALSSSSDGTESRFATYGEVLGAALGYADRGATTPKSSKSLTTYNIHSIGKIARNAVLSRPQKPVSGSELWRTC